MQPLQKGAGGSRLEVDVELGETSLACRNSGEASTNNVFFRVIAPKAASAKVLKVIKPQQRQLHRHDICLTFHEHYQDADATMVSIAPRSSGRQTPLALVSAAESNLELLGKELQVWSRAKGTNWLLPSSPTLDNDCLEKIIQAGAFPNSEKFFGLPAHSDSELSELQLLAAEGDLFQLESRGDLTRWQMTEKGLANLSLVHRLVSPKLLFELRDNVPKTDWSSWELLKAMTDGGWMVKHAPSSREKRKALLPYQGGSDEKVYYLPGVNMRHAHSYCLCLFKREELDGDAGALQVFHLQKPKYYERILAGRSNGALPLENIVEAGALMCDMEDENQEPLPAIEDQGDEILSQPASLQSLHSGDSSASSLVASDSDIDQEDNSEIVPDETDLAASHSQEAIEKIPRLRQQHPESDRHWGPFLLTFSPFDGARSFGRWQGTCKYHAKNSKTWCTKTITVKTEGDMENCKHVIQYWLIQATAFSSKSDHADFPVYRCRCQIRQARRNCIPMIS